jgi:hypothetical protein
MNEILRSHLIDPVALRDNDFVSFFNKRKESLLSYPEQRGKESNIQIFMMIQRF